MLKFEKLSFAAGLSEEEVAAAGSEVKISGSADFAKGAIAFENRITGAVVARLQAAGNVPASATITNLAPLTLHGGEVTITRTYDGDTSSDLDIDTGFGARLIDADGTGITKGSNGHITVDSGTTMPVEATLVVEAISAVAETKDLPATYTLNVDAGEIHFNGLIRVKDAPHLRHEDTSLTVRAEGPWVNVGEEAPIHLP